MLPLSFCDVTDPLDFLDLLDATDFTEFLKLFYFRDYFIITIGYSRDFLETWFWLNFSLF